jgi:hypothetical protein
MRNGNLDAHTFATSMALWSLDTFCKYTDQQFRRQKIPRHSECVFPIRSLLEGIGYLGEFGAF